MSQVNANRPLPPTPNNRGGTSTETQTGTDPATGATVTHTPSQLTPSSSSSSSSPSTSPTPVRKFVGDGSLRETMRLDQKIGAKRTPIGKLRAKSDWTSSRRSEDKRVHQRFLTRGGKNDAPPNDTPSTSSAQPKTPRAFSKEKSLVSRKGSNLDDVRKQIRGAKKPEWPEKDVRVDADPQPETTRFSRLNENNSNAMIETIRDITIDIETVEHSDTVKLESDMVATFQGEVEYVEIGTTRLMSDEEFKATQQEKKSEQ